MPAPPRPRGRPRTFDSDAALEAAVLLFWRYGYEGTSIASLTAAMGVTAPTLYAAFGSKEGLYKKALDHYVARYGGHERVEAFEREPSARAAIEAYLLGTAIGLADPALPAGCLVSTSMLFCAEENRAAAAATAALRAQTVAMIEKKIVKAHKNGELPKSADPRALARFYVAVAQGMSAQASDGATMEGLRSTAELAMRAWPEGGKKK